MDQLARELHIPAFGTLGDGQYSPLSNCHFTLLPEQTGLITRESARNTKQNEITLKATLVMLHPSTKKLIDRLAEMTVQKKIDWVTGETPDALVFDTEGYRVILQGTPTTLLLTDALGRELESASPAELDGTSRADGTPYAQVVETMRKEATRIARGTEVAISTVLEGLDAAESNPELPTPDAVTSDIEALQPDAESDEALEPDAYEDVIDEAGLIDPDPPVFETPDPDPITAAPDVTEETISSPDPVDTNLDEVPAYYSTEPAAHLVDLPVTEATEVDTSAADSEDLPDVGAAVASLANQVNQGLTEPASSVDAPDDPAVPIDEPEGAEPADAETPEPFHVGMLFDSDTMPETPSVAISDAPNTLFSDPSVPEMPIAAAAPAQPDQEPAPAPQVPEPQAPTPPTPVPPAPQRSSFGSLGGFSDLSAYKQSTSAPPPAPEPSDAAPVQADAGPSNPPATPAPAAPEATTASPTPTQVSVQNDRPTLSLSGLAGGDNVSEPAASPSGATPTSPAPDQEPATPTASDATSETAPADGEDKAADKSKRKSLASRFNPWM
ncbi:MAG: hypothetical protein AAFQ84_02700 [Pseudomonadota bacterium]